MLQCCNAMLQRHAAHRTCVFVPSAPCHSIVAMGGGPLTDLHAPHSSAHIGSDVPVCVCICVCARACPCACVQGHWHTPTRTSLSRATQPYPATSCLTAPTATFGQCRPVHCYAFRDMLPSQRTLYSRHGVILTCTLYPLPGWCPLSGMWGTYLPCQSADPLHMTLHHANTRYGPVGSTVFQHPDSRPTFGKCKQCGVDDECPMFACMQ